MKEFFFKKIDAFATEKSTGNPAGYILLDKLSDLSELEMLQIAKELSGYVNEVGYVAQIGANEFNLRYYSSEREVDFCGHATVAIFYDIAKNNAEISKQKCLVINTNRGQLEIINKVSTDNSVFIMSPEPVEHETVPSISDISIALKIEASAINQQLPVEIINAGLTTLIVPISSLDDIIGISPDMNELKEFCLKSGIDIIEVFTSEVNDPTNDYRTRVFAPTFGYLEDPATGSGNSAFGYYLIKHGQWTKDSLRIEQNGLKDRSNLVRLQKQFDTKGNIRVFFGGAAVTRIEGKYKLYR